jgi:hypothetical protein
MSDRPKYFQINQNTNLGRKKLSDSYNNLSDNDKALLARLKNGMPADARELTGNKWRGFGQASFLELLYKLILFQESSKVGGPRAGRLTKTSVVVDAVKEWERDFAARGDGDSDV